MAPKWKYDETRIYEWYYMYIASKSDKSGHSSSISINKI